MIGFGQVNLQKLIDKASDGEKVSIPEGVYTITSPLQINKKKNITINCVGECKILLTDLWKEVIEINNSSNITIDNLYLSHLKPSDEYYCQGGVIEIKESEKIIIYNCEIEGSGTIGVKTTNVNGLVVSYCFIHNNTYNAFYFNDSDDILIHNCRIEDNANLMQSYSSNIEMSDNEIKNNKGYWKRPKSYR
jgi:hypothetical protein